MTSFSLQHKGELDVQSLSFGARDLRPYAAMGLARGVITSKPEEYLRKYTGYANLSRGTYSPKSSLLASRFATKKNTGLNNVMGMSTGPKAVQHKPAKVILKAPLVPRTERPVMGLHTDRDRVYTNALETIRYVRITR